MVLFFCFLFVVSPSRTIEGYCWSYSCLSVMYRNTITVWKGPATQHRYWFGRAAQLRCLNAQKRLMTVSQNTFRATQLPEVMEENVKCGSLPVQQRGSPAGAEKNLSRFNAGRKNNQPGPLMVKWECVGTLAVGTVWEWISLYWWVLHGFHSCCY